MQKSDICSNKRSWWRCPKDRDQDVDSVRGSCCLGGLSFSSLLFPKAVDQQGKNTVRCNQQISTLWYFALEQSCT